MYIATIERGTVSIPVQNSLLHNGLAESAAPLAADHSAIQHLPTVEASANHLDPNNDRRCQGEIARLLL